ncbi:hypothetical protein IFM89_019102 [Coptis chinensis]|uniref:C2 tensin-type domain-containing protein n=1 Tax=Coptis chinensis TaxID=261450 RepID=A0A835HIJ7_9MAGN|nr:hypothetical protein IFM89_019102 [Coptis chinensis]
MNPDLYLQEESTLLKIDIRCRVQGDVVLECIHLDEDLICEEMMFRVMFNTFFIRSNIREEIYALWDAKDQLPKDFKAEVHDNHLMGVSIVEIGNWVFIS